MRTVLGSRLLPSGLLMVVFGLVASSAGCTATSAGGKITYSAHFGSVTRPAVNSPTLVTFSAMASCEKGETVLAGGYNLTVSNGMDEWLAAHPAPVEALPDKNGLYRPVPPLLRVITSQPLAGQTGWYVMLEGMMYPSEGARSIFVYAYCAAGLSTKPLVQQATTTPTPVGGKLHVDAPCPAGFLAASGGYTTGAYGYSGGTKAAHLPVYRSLQNLAANAWQVATDQFFSTFDPFPSASLTATVICVSTNDFAKIDSDNGEELPVSPETPELNMLSFAVGNDTDYRGQYKEPSSCPAGAFVLPPSYNVNFQSSQDLRVDGVWVDVTFANWNVAVSTGGAATYPSGAPILTAYKTCLVPK